MLANIILGHLVGDYILQNNWMALNKSKANWHGWLTCSVHCLLYSLAVCAFTKFDFIWFVVVFLSHYFIDHYALSNLLSKLKGNESLKEYMHKTNYSHGNVSEVVSSFNSFVYIAQDNTMHLVLMYWGWIYLMGA